MRDKLDLEELLGSVVTGDIITPVYSARFITKGKNYRINGALTRAIYIEDDRGYTTSLGDLGITWFIGACKENIELQSFASLVKKGLTKDDYKGIFDFLGQRKVRIQEAPPLKDIERIAYIAPGVPIISTDSDDLVDYLVAKDKLRNVVKANEIEALKGAIGKAEEFLQGKKDQLKQMESEQ